MKGRNLRASAAVLAVAVAALVGTGSASAATKTSTYPTMCSSMLCSFPLPTVWNQSVSYESVDCVQADASCPTITGARAAFDGVFTPAITFSGTATVAATAAHSWITPGPTPFSSGVQFIYNGAGGSHPDSLTFTIDRAAHVQALLDLGGSATTSVFLDDLDAGTSLRLVDQRPIVEQEHFATDPVVSVDPSQLTIGDRYSARVVTRFSFPVGDMPSSTIYYHNFVLRATAEDTDDDGIVDNSDNCPNVSNADQTDTDDDGQGDACDATPNGDTDEDGVDNSSDNCPGVSNVDQADLDKDHLGDACDADIDGDGVPNGSDPDPRNPDVPGASDNNGNGNGSGNGTNGGSATGDKVRVKVKCPGDASAGLCKVRVVGRAGEKGPRVTNVVRTKVKRGERKMITLTVEQPFLAQVQATGRVIVVRNVRKGPQKPKRRLLSRPVVNG
jgi:hypothetical protein